MQLQQHNTINWPEVYMMAESNNEPFADVRILTAKSEYIRVYSDYLDLGYTYNDQQSFNNVLSSAIDSHSLDVYESVSIDGDGAITVVINCDAVTDDATWTALDMVAHAMEQLNGEEGTIRFGSPLSFKSTDIPWLTLH